MNQKTARWILWIVVSGGALVGISLLSLSVGPAGIPVRKILSLIQKGEGGVEHSIIFNIRLPRIILGFAIGGALSLAGVILQEMFRNPLVEPYTLGISGGAAITEDLHGIVFWIMGSLEEPDWFLIKLALWISIAGLAVSYLFCFDLNALSLGEEEALHLGVNIESAKRWLLIIASLLTGFSVSVAGIIGFVGLVVPHFVRMFVGPDHRILLISAFICGAGFLIFCDTVARTVIAPTELPVGVITGILGGSLFVYALNKKRVVLGER